MSMKLFAANVPCELKFGVSEASPHGLGVRGLVANSIHGGFAQGWALEKLGHAVEHLVDSRLFDLNAQRVRDEQEAVQILMRMSRAIFSECTKDGRARLGEDWVTGVIAGRQNEAIGTAAFYYT